MRKLRTRKQRRAAIRDGFRFGLQMTGKEDYQQYLRSKWWKIRRLQKLKSVGFICQRCRTRDQLEVRHLHYCSLGRERNADLMVLCRKCHQLAHGIKA